MLVHNNMTNFEKQLKSQKIAKFLKAQTHSSLAIPHKMCQMN
jgi:hypothetical protein